MIPSMCIPHVDAMFSADFITETFNKLFEVDCVKEVHLKRKQFTYPNGNVRDYNLCFIHFKEAEFKQDILDVCLLDITNHKHFVVKPYENQRTFWKVFLYVKPPKPIIIRKE